MSFFRQVNFATDGLGFRGRSALELHIGCFQGTTRRYPFPQPRMMDPQQHPTGSELRDFSRRVWDATKRAQSRLQEQLSSETDSGKTRASEPLSTLEELRAAEDELRARNEELAARREAEEALRELNRELELRVESRTAQLAAANLKKDQLIFSERKAREEAEIANKIKSDFLALLSHEFRTPLQAIFGYTELLEREIHGPLNEPQRRDLKRIQQSQQHLLGLITTILDFARLESGHDLEFQIESLLVHDLLETMEGFIGPDLESKQLKYEYRCEDKTILAQVDAAKLQQILLNLLANAVKFTPVGGMITVECEAVGDKVVVRVADSGIGIPADKLEAIFEPFVQIRDRESVQSGTGLGLSISRRLATAMGGELVANSVQRRGSTFSLSLPKATKARESLAR